MASRESFKGAVALLGAVVALGSAAAGCGGGDGTATAAPELTKPQFVKQASAICQRAVEEKEAKLVAAIKKEVGKGLFGATDSQLEKLATKVVLPVYGETISQLGRLNPQPKDRARVAKILHSYEAALKKAEADPVAALEKNPFAKADEAATAYGFGCVF